MIHKKKRSSNIVTDKEDDKNVTILYIYLHTWLGFQTEKKLYCKKLEIKKFIILMSFNEVDLLRQLLLTIKIIYWVFSSGYSNMRYFNINLKGQVDYDLGIKTYQRHNNFFS